MSYTLKLITQAGIDESSTRDITVYTFDNTFRIVGEGVGLKGTVESVPYRDGGVQIGDRNLAPQTIELQGLIRSTTTEGAQTLLNSLNSALVSNIGNELGLMITRNTDIYIRRISNCLNIDPQNMFHTSERIKNISITLELADPLKYTGKNILSVSIANPTSYNIVTTGNRSIAPVWKFAGTGGASVTITDGTGTFTITDTLNTHTYIIDCYAGEVYKDGVLNNALMSAGYFFKLSPGASVITISNATGTLTHYVRSAWI